MFQIKLRKLTGSGPSIEGWGFITYTLSQQDEDAILRIEDPHQETHEEEIWGPTLTTFLSSIKEGKIKLSAHHGKLYELLLLIGEDQEGFYDRQIIAFEWQQFRFTQHLQKSAALYREHGKDLPPALQRALEKYCS